MVTTCMYTCSYPHSHAHPHIHTHTLTTHTNVSTLTHPHTHTHSLRCNSVSGHPRLLLNNQGDTIDKTLLNGPDNFTVILSVPGGFEELGYHGYFSCVDSSSASIGHIIHPSKLIAI